MADYEKLVLWLKNKTGLDLRSYKSVQMKRRLRSLMEFKDLSTFAEYITLLETDPDSFDEFLKRLTINVSDFFRNPERFQDLEEVILPRLLVERKELKTWSAGCANGSEPYSLAMILHKLGAREHQKILATDLDQKILEYARQAIYTENEIKGVSEKMRERYFTKVEQKWQVQDFIREKVKFQAHNLLKDPFPSDCDLILCRNVVIYFTPEAKDLLYPRLFQALRPGGVLMVGGTEPILRYGDYGFQQLGPGFYRRES